MRGPPIAPLNRWSAGTYPGENDPSSENGRCHHASSLSSLWHEHRFPRPMAWGRWHHGI